MNKKILITSVLLLAVVMLATPLVAAKPGAEKKNDKFLKYEVWLTGGPSEVLDVIFKPAPPPDANFQQVIISEHPGENEITIDESVTYYLGIDFTYSSVLTLTYHLNSVPLVGNVRVDYTYTFLPASGITGTLELLAIGKLWPTGEDGTSLLPTHEGTISGKGTGDLKGVKVSAVSWFEALNGDDFNTIFHEGTITNWPMPPA